MKLAFAAALSAGLLVYTFLAALGASDSYRFAVGLSAIFVGAWCLGFLFRGAT